MNLIINLKISPNVRVCKKLQHPKYTPEQSGGESNMVAIWAKKQ